MHVDIDLPLSQFPRALTNFHYPHPYVQTLFVLNLAYIGRLYTTLQIVNRLLSILFIYVCYIYNLLK
jgi:hypothetical protein